MKSRHLILGFVIAVLALFVTFRNVSFQEVILSIKGLEYQYLPLAALVFFASFVVRVYRWQYLCRSMKRIPARRLYSPMMIGFMGNLLPLRAGEFIRAYLLGKREEISLSACLATIVVERLFDIISILVLFAVLLVTNPLALVPQAEGGDPAVAAGLRSFGAISLAVCAGLVAFCFFLVHQQERAMRFAGLFTRHLPERLEHRIHGILRSFTQGLGIFREPKGILVTGLLSAVLWAVIILANYPLYWSYRIQAILPLSSLVTLVVFLCAAVMIPTPGFVGPFQFAVTFVLADLYSVERASAASFSLVAWFIQMGVICMGGIYFLVRDQVSLVEVSRRAREMGSPGEGLSEQAGEGGDP